MIFCTGAGEYWLMMFDTFAGSMGLIVIAFFESVVVAYVYGHKKFTDDIEKMVGDRPGFFWQIMWRFITPVTIFVIVVASVVYRIYSPPQYNAYKQDLARGEKEPYPGWAMFVAMALLLGGVLPIPVVYLMRRFQCIRLDSDIQQASIKRVETTMSTQGMIRNESEIPRIDSGFPRNETGLSRIESGLPRIDSGLQSNTESEIPRNDSGIWTIYRSSKSFLEGIVFDTSKDERKNTEKSEPEEGVRLATNTGLEETTNENPSILKKTKEVVKLEHLSQTEKLMSSENRDHVDNV